MSLFLAIIRISISDDIFDMANALIFTTLFLPTFKLLSNNTGWNANSYYLNQGSESWFSTYGSKSTNSEFPSECFFKDFNLRFSVHYLTGKAP